MNKEYKKIKSEWIEALGMGCNVRLSQGLIVLLMTLDGSEIKLTSSSKEDMVDYIKNLKEMNLDFL